MPAPVYPADPLLLIDDEEDVLQSYKMTLRMNRVNNFDLCSDSRQVATLLAAKRYSTVVLDLSMPDVSGREILGHIRQRYPHVPVIVVTGTNEVATAVDCMKEGAYDYMVKPVDDSRLISSIHNAQELVEVRRENDALKEKLLDRELKNPAPFASIITVSHSMRSIFGYIEAVAPTTRPVLITGESGTGKELFARAVHEASGRRGKFVPVNVGGLDDTVFSDTLFGHKRGAFTGADGERVGLIEQARGGTLFLDEIGTLDKQSQVKLLRLLQEKEYYPLGSDTHKTAQVAVVAATNGDIRALMSSGAFRSDLYYRLLTHHIEIPPLRKRIEDIPYLVDHFAVEAAEQIGREPCAVPEEIHGILAGYSFPGNVRELQAMIFDAVSRCVDGNPDPVLIRERVRREALLSGAPVDREEKTPTQIYYVGGFPTMDQVETFFIDKAMKLANSNQSMAARMLGVSQSTVSRRARSKND